MKIEKGRTKEHRKTHAQALAYRHGKCVEFRVECQNRTHRSASSHTFMAATYNGSRFHQSVRATWSTWAKPTGDAKNEKKKTLDLYHEDNVLQPLSKRRPGTCAEKPSPHNGHNARHMPDSGPSKYPRFPVRPTCNTKIIISLLIKWRETCVPEINYYRVAQDSGHGTHLCTVSGLGSWVGLGWFKRTADLPFAYARKYLTAKTNTHHRRVGFREMIHEVCLQQVAINLQAGKVHWSLLRVVEHHLFGPFCPERTSFSAFRLISQYSLRQQRRT